MLGLTKREEEKHQKVVGENARILRSLQSYS
jgi:hypothetical protein